MAPVIPIIGALAPAIGKVIGGTIGLVVGLAVSTLSTVLGAVVGGKRPSRRDPGVPATVRQPITHRRIVYGRRRVGGVLVHAQLANKNNDQLLIAAVSQGVCRGPVRIFFGDEEVWTRTGEPQNGDVAAFGTWLNGWEAYAEIEWYDGSQTTASSRFVALSGGDDRPLDVNSSATLTAPTNVRREFFLKSVEVRAARGEVLTEDRQWVRVAWDPATGGVVSRYRVEYDVFDGDRAVVFVPGDQTSLEVGSSDLAAERPTVAAEDAEGNWTDAVDQAGGMSPRSSTWKSTSVGVGVAYFAARLRWDKKRQRFPSGVPNITLEIEGRRDIFDPRSGTASYTANAALIARHYLLDAVVGGHAAAEEIDDADWIAHANLCDEPVPLDGGGTEPRYEVHAEVSADESRVGALTDIMAAAASNLIFSSGLFRPIDGGAGVSVATYTDDDLRGPLTTTIGRSRADTWNTVIGEFANPENLYVPAEYPPVTDAAYVAEDGRRIERTLNLPFTASAAAAQRLAKIVNRQGRRKIFPTVRLPMRAIQHEVGDVITLASARYGWGAQDFRIESIRQVAIAPDPGSDPLSVYPIEVSLSEADAAEFQWSAAEAQAANLPARVIVDPVSVRPPLSSTYEVKADVQPDGGTEVRTLIKWEASPSEEVRRYEVQYEDAGEVTTEFATGLSKTVLGAAAEVLIRAVGSDGRRSAWVPAARLGGYQVTDPSAPGPVPFATMVADLFGHVIIEADAPADTDFVRFAASVGSPFQSFDLAQPWRIADGTRITLGGLPLGEEKRVWLQAVDRTGNVSDPIDLGIITPGYDPIAFGQSGDDQPPAAPQNWTAVKSTNGTVTFTGDAQSEDDLAGFILYLGLPGSAFADAVPVARSVSTNPEIVYTNIAPGPDFRFWIVAVDRSGNESVPLGPLDVARGFISPAPLDLDALETAAADTVRQAAINRDELSQEKAAREDEDTLIRQDITTLSGKVTTAEGAITAIETLSLAPESALLGKFSEIEASVSDLEGDVSAAEASITAIEALTLSPTSALVQRFEGIETDVAGVSADVSNILAVSNISGTALSTLLTSFETELDDQQAGSVASELSLLVGPDGAQAKREVKFNLNGAISGYGLSSTSQTDGSPQSQFIVDADEFVITDTNGALTDSPFFVQTLTGTRDGVVYEPGVYARSAYLSVAQVGTLQIGDNAVTVPAGSNEFIVVQDSGSDQTAASVSVNIPQNADIQIVGIFTSGFSSSTRNFTMKLKMNGGTVASQVVSFPGITTTVLADIVSANAGTNTFAMTIAANLGAGGISLLQSEAFITVVAAQR